MTEFAQYMQVKLNALLVNHNANTNNESMYTVHVQYYMSILIFTITSIIFSDSKPAGMRPPKPVMAPPTYHQLSRSPNLSPSSEHSSSNSRSPSPRGASAMTVKVHYTTTRAIRVASSITYPKLLHLICRKFDRPDNSLTLW